MIVPSRFLTPRQMKPSIWILLTVIFFLAAANRLPAPIVEENSTPAQEKPARPKPKRTTKSENEPSTSTRSRPPETATTPIQNKFDGTWAGTLNNIPLAGNVAFTLAVTGAGTLVTEKSANWGTESFQANCDGSTMRWEWPHCSWTLTPNPALVTLNCPGVFGVAACSLSTVFRRASTSAITQTAPRVITDTGGPAPVAKPVPDRPGFVYNPFDPNSKVLLGVRGKASGTKLIEPKSGRLFTVP